LDGLRLSLKGYNLGQIFEKNVVQDLVGKIATCSICGKKKRIENQRIRVGQFDEDIYLECRDCAAIEL